MSEEKTVATPAATVMLLRTGAEGQPEVLLLQRHRKSHFMPGAHVFPGGRVEASDQDAGWDALCEGLSPRAAAQILGGEGEQRVDPRTALGYFVAAARECFEEAGVLIARDTGGNPITQGAELDREQDFQDLLRREGWSLDLGRVRYQTHWITPEAEPRRFDTRFFVTWVPDDTTGAHCGIETTETLWIRPSEALARSEAETLFVLPPTLTCLRWLSQFETPEAALSGAPHAPVPAVMPVITVDGEQLCINLPGSEPHPDDAPLPEHPRRLKLAGKRWELDF